MPRPSRGGARQGNPGTNYANRSDLRGPKALPITTVPGQQYGQATAQANAQKAVPMASGPIGIQGSAGPQPAQSAPPMEGQPVPPSVPLTPLFAPTQNPDQPVTSGVSNSPGVGPEALNLSDPIQGQYQNAKSLIQSLASAPDASPALQFLAQRINGAY